MAPRSQGRRTDLPVESSWRMVEGGENDSFDTSIVHDPYADDLVLSSEPSQVASSQGYSIGSQDSIGDFARNADEDHVILRSPFHPSLASTRHTSLDQDRTPVPEFFMPKLEAESPQQSAHSSRTLRPSGYEQSFVRQRTAAPRSNWPGGFQRPPERHATHSEGPSRRGDHSLGDRVAAAAPEFVFNTIAWCFSVVGMALQWAKWPLAIIMALYMIIGAGMIAKSMITESISSSLSPLCRIPGVSMLDVPFCPDLPPVPGPGGNVHVEFDGLMAAQSQFEKVLEDSARGVSLPMEMKRTEASVRDLRTMVKYSELPARDELVHEFDNYIGNVHTIADDLQTFNTHVGSAVDSVISINRWTSRYIDSIAASREARNNMLSRWSDWMFSPFQPQLFDERMLLDKYVEHTGYVSERIARLIVEAHAAIHLLKQAEDSLGLINEHVVRSNNAVKDKHQEVFWTLWTLVGGNTRRLHNLKSQLVLLKQVDFQRKTAFNQLSGLIGDLQDIQTKLDDLRDRVAEPGLLADRSSIPLSVHIETINAGVERLESARSRIRAEENDRLQEALSRAKGDERLIEG